MSPVAFGIAVIAACAFGGIAASLAMYLRGASRLRAQRRRKALAEQGVAGGPASSGDMRNIALRYAESLTRQLFTGATAPFSPSVRAKRAGKTRSGRWYLELAASAGCSRSVSVSGFCEAQVRLTGICMAAGALIGALLSTEMAVLLCIGGAVLGYMLLPRAVKRLKHDRSVCAERHLSEMLEVVALGLRSGLTFDRSFELYGLHFDNEFARECARAYRQWSLGLSSREDSLRDLAASFDCRQLSRVVETVLRSLRFGSSMTGMLEEAAAQSRAAYQTALEERVAKAPVKMMLPTGALILPAMLLLVMGPILLELSGGF